MNIEVSCAAGTEAVVKRELFALGIADAPAINGRLRFEGDIKTVAKCNLFLRAANRVFIELAQFDAPDFDALFDGVKAIDWGEYIPADGKIDVSAKCVESKIHAVSVTQSITKKALCEKLAQKYRRTLDESGERYKIETSILKDRASVCLDTTGSGLHRRGYRGLVGEAPLKETLASAVIELSVWKPGKPFADLFCGTGTFGIEAAMAAKKIPSGLKRGFDFTQWKNFDGKAIMARLKDEARENIVKNPDFCIYGCDVDEKQLELAKIHAINAGVADCTRFEKADMRDFTSEERYGVVFANPPYGERMTDVAEAEKLIKDFGKVYRRLKDWSAYVITPAKNFEYLFGKRAEKRRKLYNGSIECCLYGVLGNPPPKTFVGDGRNGADDNRRF